MTTHDEELGDALRFYTGELAKLAPRHGGRTVADPASYRTGYTAGRQDAYAEGYDQGRRDRHTTKGTHHDHR